MVRFLKVLLALVVLGLAGLALFAYLGDLAPEPGERRQEILLDAD